MKHQSGHPHVRMQIAKNNNPAISKIPLRMKINIIKIVITIMIVTNRIVRMKISKINIIGNMMNINSNNATICKIISANIDRAQPNFLLLEIFSKSNEYLLMNNLVTGNRYLSLKNFLLFSM